MAVPPGAVAGLLDPNQRSGWQLAQEVWQESGVTWNAPSPNRPTSKTTDRERPTPSPGPPARLGSADAHPRTRARPPSRSSLRPCGGYATLRNADCDYLRSADYERSAADARPGGPEPGDFDPDITERLAGRCSCCSRAAGAARSPATSSGQSRCVGGCGVAPRPVAQAQLILHGFEPIADEEVR